MYRPTYKLGMHNIIFAMKKMRTKRYTEKYSKSGVVCLHYLCSLPCRLWVDLSSFCVRIRQHVSLEIPAAVWNLRTRLAPFSRAIYGLLGWGCWKQWMD